MTTARAEARWRTRGQEWPEWAQAYWDAWQQPCYDPIKDSILAANPGTVLDVGCGPGAMLRRLRADRPRLGLYGVDVSPEAVAWVRAHLPDVAMGEGSVVRLDLALDPWLPRRFDVVTAQYCLAYVSPKDLPRALLGLLVRTRKRLVLAEPMPLGSLVAGPVPYVGNGCAPEWRHDYAAILRDGFSREARVEPIPGKDRLNAMLILDL